MHSHWSVSAARASRHVACRRHPPRRACCVPPRPPSSSARDREISAVDAGEVVITTIPGQGRRPAPSRTDGPTSSSIRSTLRYGMSTAHDESAFQSGGSGGTQSPRRREQWTDATDVVTQNFGIECRQWLSRCRDHEHRRTTGASTSQPPAPRTFVPENSSVALSRPIRREAPPAKHDRRKRSGRAYDDFVVTPAAIPRSKCPCHEARIAERRRRGAWFPSQR